MKNIPLNDLCQSNFNINNYFSMYQYWPEGYIISMESKQRNKSGFLYFLGSDGKFTYGEKTVHAERGEIFYLPPHAKYSVTFLNVTEGMAASILLDVWLADASGEEIVLSDNVFRICSDSKGHELLKRFEAIDRIYTTPVPNIAKLKQLIYQLISDFSYQYRIKQLTKHELIVIKPGIDYLESDGEQDLSIKEIAALCHISEVTFRKLFKQYSGVSPSAFRISKKINKAKELLESDVYNISEVSDILGFENISYFSRLFKKYTGISPKQYQSKDTVLH